MEQVNRPALGVTGWQLWLSTRPPRGLRLPPRAPSTPPGRCALKPYFLSPTLCVCCRFKCVSKERNTEGLAPGPSQAASYENRAFTDAVK